MKKYIYITSLILLVLIICGLVLFIMFQNQWKNKANTPEVKNTYVYDLGDPFITNMLGSKRFLKASIVIEMEDSKQSDYISKNNYKIRDTIIHVLRNKSEEEMNKPDIVEILKKEIKNDLQNKLKIDKMNDVFFNEFVIQ